MPTALRPRVDKQPDDDNLSEYSAFSDSDDALTSKPKTAKPRKPRPQRDVVEDFLRPGGALPLGETGCVPNAVAWSPAEDSLLLAAIERHGPKWGVIARDLQKQGCMRTTAMARNRYARIQAAGKGPGRNKCKRCGQVKRGHTCTAEDPVIMRTLPEGVAMSSLDRVCRVPNGGPQPTIAKKRRSRPPVGLHALLAPPPEEHVEGALRSLPLLAKPSGNDFRVDVDAFLAEFQRHNPESTHAPLAQLTGLTGYGAALPPPLVSSAGAAPGSAVPSMTGMPLTASALCAQFAADDAALAYLASAQPPPVCAAAAGAGTAAQRRMHALSFGGASVISDRADLVDLRDLSSAADAALAAKAANSFGALSEPTALLPAASAEGPDGSASGLGPAAELPRADDEMTMASDEDDAAKAASPPPPAVAVEASAHPSARLLLPGAMQPPALSTTGSRCDSPLSFLQRQASSGGGMMPPLPTWSRAPSFSFADRPGLAAPLSFGVTA